MLLTVCKSKKRYNLRYKIQVCTLIFENEFWLKLIFQKYSLCVPFRALLVCFRNRHQYNVTFRHWYSITFWGGGWKDDQISKYRFWFTVIRKRLLEFSSFISIRYVIHFLIKYNRVTVTLIRVITKKNLYLNLLVTNKILLWVAI